MFCTKCGQELPDGSAFCTKCGAPVSPQAPKNEAAQDAEAVQADGVDVRNEGAPAQGVAEPSAAPAQNATAATTPVTPAAASAPVSSPTPHISGRAKKRSGKPIIIVALLAAIAIIAGAAIYTLFLSPYSIDSSTFPDDTLRRAISRAADSDRDGMLSRSEASELTKLDLSDSEVEDLKGIELLPNLKTLNLANCSYVESIDVSKNGALETLVLRGTDVQELDVSHNSHLAKLDITGCAIESLDLSHNRELKELIAIASDLESLNLSGCENLESANVRLTNLTELDVSSAKKLEEFAVDEDVDVKGVENTNLREQWVLTSASISGAHGPAYPVMGGMGETSTKYIELTYDSNNNVTGYQTEISYPYASSGSSTENVTFNYNDGRVASIDKSTTSTDSRGRNTYSTNTYSYSYNDAGQLSSYSSRYKSNSPSYYYYSYDENGRQTSSDSYRFVYDETGRLSSIVYKSSGKTLMTISYDRNNRVEKVSYNDYDASYTFEYDMAGRCTARHYTTSTTSYGDSSYDINFSYDSTGNVSEIQVVGANGVVSGTVTFEYDANGNMVKRTVENPGFSSESYYDKGSATFTYSRVYTRSDAPDLQFALYDSNGMGNFDGVNIPFDQTFATDDLARQTGMFDYLGGRPYLY